MVAKMANEGRLVRRRRQSIVTEETPSEKRKKVRGKKGIDNLI